MVISVFVRLALVVFVGGQTSRYTEKLLRSYYYCPPALGKSYVLLKKSTVLAFHSICLARPLKTDYMLSKGASINDITVRVGGSSKSPVNGILAYILKIGWVGRKISENG